MNTTDLRVTVIGPDRRFVQGQGYTRILLLNARLGDPAFGPEHKLQVTVHQGNHREYAHAKVERWDGERWEVVTYRPGTEIPEGPSYVTFPWTRASHPGAKATREDCDRWLEEQAEAALEIALGVLR